MRISGACAILALATAAHATKLPTPDGAAAPAGDSPAAAGAATTAPVAPVAQATATAAAPATFEQRIDRMLSAALLADLFPFTRDPDISDEGYEAAMALALQCARLAPERRAGWDLVILLADQVEGGAPDAARAARRESLAALARLDPADDVIRLARVAEAIESHTTADARVRAYESMLAPANRAALGGPVASRLAYQLASLESRIGNTELFARWLAEAVKADPGYPAAAQAAAGFFRMRVSDPAADVELLSVAVEANPRDLATWSALVSVLLDGGAFKGAERAARLAITVAEAERRPETVYSLTGDLATALWGSGQRAEAMHELDLRMNRLTEDFRRMISLMDPSITNERLTREFPPLPSSLSIAMLGVAKKDGNQKKLAELLDQALRGADAEIRRAKERGDSDAAIGSYDIQKITTLLLFGSEMRTVPGLIENAAKSGALGGDGKARFEAMLLWRQGKPEEAAKALEPMRENDPLAHYAYASALADLKRPHEAAKEFRAIAESRIGTSISLLALDRLAEVLGQQVVLTSQLTPALKEVSAALDKALQTQLPLALDEMMEHPLRALTVEVTPSSTQIKPYEQFSFTIRMRNNSRIPLAIGGDCPITGKVTMRAAAPRPGNSDPAELPPQPILIDRRLRLGPGEEITVNIEADLTMVGLVLNVQPLDAHLVNVAVVSNPSAATGGVSAGFLGSVTGCPPIQFTGVDVTAEWLTESRALIRSAGNVDAVTRLALLVHAAADPKRLPEAARADTKAIWTDVVEAWKALPERAQAWVIGVMPEDTPEMAPLLEAAKASTSPTVLRSWAITRVVDPKDPMLDVCRRSGDADLGKLADAVTWVAERRAKRAIEDVGMEQQRPAQKSAPMPKDALPGGGKP
jgi:tetratricopeptide (TPR) repeat protein